MTDEHQESAATPAALASGPPSDAVDKTIADGHGFKSETGTYIYYSRVYRVVEVHQHHTSQLSTMGEER